MIYISFILSLPEKFPISVSGYHYPEVKFSGGVSRPAITPGYAARTQRYERYNATITGGNEAQRSTHPCAWYCYAYI
ncbi:MAG: hypothetical protein BWK80_26450 [Desulfobacteraceae bacterium IS3]|nr:MAG: hypothetical protein BWK80_26450 [Desulfobacteraceae bacterium IS3]